MSRASDVRVGTSPGHGPEPPTHDHDHDHHDHHDHHDGARRPEHREAHRSPAGHAGPDSHRGGGHAGHAGHADQFRRLFWWSLILAVPVVVFSEMVQEWFGYSIDVAGAGLVAPMLGTVVFVVGGRPFLVGAVDEVRNRRPGMMMLIAVAITVAFGASLASTVDIGDLEFWWELAALIVVMLLGHWLEMRAIGQASGALAALAELLPDEAERLTGTGTGTETVARSRLVVGDVVLVRPGARVPADGTIVDGGAAMDESMITGESRPVARHRGERVIAGTVATDSAIRVRVDAVGDDTALAGIQRLVAQAQESRSRAQALADRAAAALFAVAMVAAVVAVVGWSVAGDPAEGIVAAVTVLVIACPHALGLAIPLVVAISTATSARAGILVKDRLALERMRSVDTVLFDKTGTLTRGNHALVGHVAVAGGDADRVLAIAAAVEADSEHPIGRAIVAAARSRASDGPGVAAPVRRPRPNGPRPGQ
jgi:P-type Cu2+ transporter